MLSYSVHPVLGGESHVVALSHSVMYGHCCCDPSVNVCRANVNFEKHGTQILKAMTWSYIPYIKISALLGVVVLTMTLPLLVLLSIPYAAALSACFWGAAAGCLPLGCTGASRWWTQRSTSTTQVHRTQSCSGYEESLAWYYPGRYCIAQATWSIPSQHPLLSERSLPCQWWVLLHSLSFSTTLWWLEQGPFQWISTSVATTSHAKYSQIPF